MDEVGAIPEPMSRSHLGLAWISQCHARPTDECGAQRDGIHSSAELLRSNCQGRDSSLRGCRAACPLESRQASCRLEHERPVQMLGIMAQNRIHYTDCNKPVRTHSLSLFRNVARACLDERWSCRLGYEHFSLHLLHRNAHNKKPTWSNPLRRRPSTAAW